MPRFARFAKPNGTAIVINLEHIITVTEGTQEDLTHIVVSTGMGIIEVQGKLEHVESILEVEYGQVFDAVPGDH